MIFLSVLASKSSPIYLFFLFLSCFSMVFPTNLVCIFVFLVFVFVFVATDVLCRLSTMIFVLTVFVAASF